MSYEQIPGFTMTDEQCTAYIAEVEKLIESRQRNGSLISVYDLVAGAGMVLFLAGRNDRFPAKWFLVTVRPDYLPQGLQGQVDAVHEQLETIKGWQIEYTSLIQEAEKMNEAMKALKLQMTALVEGTSVILQKAKQWEAEDAELAAANAAAAPKKGRG